MELNSNLLKALKLEKFEIPTDIQQKAIPLILQRKDLMASAETGSGKTAAFMLPALQMLENASQAKGRGPRVLILAPTRELANQIYDTAKKIGKFTSARFACITGGVPYFHQERALRGLLDILIATPGRLIDHMSQNRVDFSRLELFILDEADRMLDMGFKKEIEKVMAVLPKQRQTLLFSATLEGPVANIAKQLLNDPVRVQLAEKAKPHALITQRIHAVDDIRHKHSLLNHVLEQPGMWQAIVFTRTKQGAERLSRELSVSDIQCAALHGDMKQSKRTKTLQQLHRGEVQVLVATDVAARGIDVKKISHVINFDMPKTVDDYIHRIGRTGRSGETGIAISFVAPDEWRQISQIERVTGQSLERCVIPGLEPKKINNNNKNNNTKHNKHQSRSGRGQRNNAFRNENSSKMERYGKEKRPYSKLNNDKDKNNKHERSSYSAKLLSNPTPKKPDSQFKKFKPRNNKKDDSGSFRKEKKSKRFYSQKQH